MTIKSINLQFFMHFCNALKFTSFFVPHLGKFTPGQSRFYDGKFTAVNLKKGVNRKTGVKVRCLVSGTNTCTNFVVDITTYSWLNMHLPVMVYLTVLIGNKFIKLILFQSIFRLVEKPNYLIIIVILSVIPVYLSIREYDYCWLLWIRVKNSPKNIHLIIIKQIGYYLNWRYCF